MKRPHNLQHQVLKLVGLGIRATDSIFDALTPDVKLGGYQRVVEALEAMEKCKFIQMSNDKWEFGVTGYAELNHYEVLAKQSDGKDTTTATVQEVRRVGTYLGAELALTCLRPGAYDYLACPSLVNGERFRHKTSHLATLGE